MVLIRKNIETIEKENRKTNNVIEEHKLERERQDRKNQREMDEFKGEYN